MAKKKVSQAIHTSKKREEKPVSDEIRRAAAKIGATPSESASPEPVPGSREDFEQWTAKREAIGSLPLTLTLAEACDLVGRDLSPTHFQEQVFDVLARDLDVLAVIGEGNMGTGFDGWCAFQNLIARIQLAGKIAAVIGGVS